MEPQHWGMVALFVLSAVFPGIALIRVYRKAVADFKDFSQAATTPDDLEPSTDHFNVMMRSWHRAQKRGPIVARKDALLIGAGLALACFASVWAVVDSVSR